MSTKPEDKSLKIEGALPPAPAGYVRPCDVPKPPEPAENKQVKPENKS